MEVQKYSRSKGDDSDILAVPIFYKADIGDEGAIENIESLTEHKTGSQFMNFQEAITKATREECKALIFLNPDGVFDERVLSNAIPQFSVIAMI